MSEKVAPQHEEDDQAIARLVQFGLAASPVESPQIQIAPRNESEFIGRYRLIEEIGEGGMGVVWRAQQLEDVKRQVALKVIRAGVGSQSTITRFEAERQAIAMMDHPNIAVILDAGSTKDGRPYFVMELVDGMPLGKYCQKNQLTVRQRLELMIPVCRAIQHAHQKGIIHRDLKHSNVIVMESDGKAIPKVIDFGLAKALEHRARLTDETIYTEAGRVVGTIQYMSPEQASESQVDVDTRSDIYSLGVMTYKLLTGDTPLGKDTVESLSFIETLAFIRDRDPVRPSQVVKDGSVEPDLDWIVMKALEKDRRDRYETVDALALDLQRYLNNEVVSARPTTGLYAVRKFVRRNRGLVAAVLAIALLLLSGIVVTAMTARWALTERDYAQKTTRIREVELYSMRLNSALRDWQLGRCESAWRTMGLLNEFEGWEKDFLRSEFSSGEKVLFGHHCWIEAVDASPDGKWIATGSIDYTVKIWDSETTELVHTFQLPDQVTDVTFTADSSTIAATTRSNEIVIFSVSPFAKVRSIGPFDEDLICVDFSADDQFLVVGSAHTDSTIAVSGRDESDPLDPMLRVISVESGETVSAINAHTQNISCVSTCPKNNLIATGSDDNTVCVWSLSKEGELQLLGTLDNHLAGVSGVDFSPSGELLATSSFDSTVLIWDVESRSVVRALSSHDGSITSVRFDRKGERLVTSSEDRTVRIWDINGTELRLCQGHFDPPVDACFIPGRDEIVSVSLDTTTRIWATNRNPNTVSANLFDDTIWSADFSPDESMIAACGDDWSLKFFDANSGELIGEPIKENSSLLAVHFSPDGKQLAYAGMEGLIRIVDVQSRQVRTTLEHHKDFIWSLDYSPDGSRLISGSADNEAIVWDTRDWSIVASLGGHNGEVTGVQFSHDGNRIVTAGHDKVVRLWDAKSYKLIREFKGHRNPLWRAVFSYDDSKLASCSNAGKIIIWDTATGKRIQDLDGHQNEVAGIAFTPAGDRLISASDDRTIRVWHLETGIELLMLSESAGTQAVHLSFSPNGKKIVVGSTAGIATIYGASRAAADPVLPQTTEAEAIQGFAVLLDRSASQDEIVSAFEAAKRGCASFPGHETLRNLGIAHYRLGDPHAAVEALDESLRLEPVQYGETLFNPNIEAFRAMALHKCGKIDAAKEARESFTANLIEEGLDTSPATADLQAEIAEVFGTSQ